MGDVVGPGDDLRVVGEGAAVAGRDAGVGQLQGGDGLGGRLRGYGAGVDATARQYAVQTVGELGEILLDLGGSVLRTQNPQLTGDDCRVVAVAALVVGLGEQAEEGALGGQGDDGEGFGDEGFGLDGADPCQERSVPHSVADGRAPMAHRRS